MNLQHQEVQCRKQPCISLNVLSEKQTGTTNIKKHECHLNRDYIQYLLTSSNEKAVCISWLSRLTVTQNHDALEAEFPVCHDTVFIVTEIAHLLSQA